MDTNSEIKLELDPDVMVNKEQEQSTTAIDQKYGVSLFQDKEADYTLYQYDQVNNEIYHDDTDYQLEIDSNQFSNLFTDPEVYSVETSVITTDVTNLLYGILLIQILVVGYFIVKIVKIKGSR